MLKTNKVLLAITAMTLSFGLTGCGKDNYQGTYTGYEVLGQAQTTTTTGGTNPQYYPQAGYGTNMVTLTLTDSGNVVSGTYSVTSAYQTTGQYPQTGAAMTSQFQASAENSGSLSNVSLLKISQYGGQPCLYTGSLSSSNHGQTINGTLNAAATSGQIGNYCGTLTLSLTRGN